MKLPTGLKIDYKLTFEPKRIVSIIGPSRSGTTIFKHALCLHPELCSLAGEEEPYYKITENGYPWHHSDEFHVANNPEHIKLLIANEINNYENLGNRSVLQSSNYEESPFVDPIVCRRTDTLVLKTPQNCYRRGVLEQLYPDAEIIVIKIHRDPRAVVNGLIDGWKSGQFKARFTNKPEEQYVGWWCFDMPPNWSWVDEEGDRLSILYRSINQWRQATKFMHTDYVCTGRGIQGVPGIRFSDFEDDWLEVCKDVWSWLGLRKFEPATTELPILSATDNPCKERWKVKRPWLAEIEELNNGRV